MYKSVVTAVSANASNAVWTALSVLDYAIAANEKVQIEYDLSLVGGGTNSGGMKFDMTGPASPSAVAWGIVGFTATNVSPKGEAASGTAYLTSTAAWCSATNTKLPVHMFVTVHNGGTAGTISLRIAANTSGDSITVGAGSSIKTFTE